MQPDHGTPLPKGRVGLNPLETSIVCSGPSERAALGARGKRLVILPSTLFWRHSPISGQRPVLTESLVRTIKILCLTPIPENKRKSSKEK